MEAKICVLDTASFSSCHGDLVTMVESVLQRLQRDRIKVILVFKDECLWAAVRRASGRTGCLYLPAFNEPTILDTLELCIQYDNAYFITAFDLSTLEADWRVSSSTKAWLKKYTSQLQVTYFFDQHGIFHPSWPVPEPAPRARGPERPRPRPLERPEFRPQERPEVKQAAEPAARWLRQEFVKLPTGWWTDQLEPEMAVLPLRVAGALQPVLAIVGANEKDPILQQAVSWCNNLPCIKVQEHEDFQTWCAAQVRGPWSDRGWTSHVAFAVGGEIDGLWAIGAGTKKLARKRAARLALLVAERAQRHGAGPQDPLWDLVERAKQLLEHACSANVEADAVDGALSTGPLNGEDRKWPPATSAAREPARDVAAAVPRQTASSWLSNGLAE